MPLWEVPQRRLSRLARAGIERREATNKNLAAIGDRVARAQKSYMDKVWATQPRPIQGPPTLTPEQRRAKFFASEANWANRDNRDYFYGLNKPTTQSQSAAMALLGKSGIETTPEQRLRLIAQGPQAVQSLIEQGNVAADTGIGNVSNLGALAALNKGASAIAATPASLLLPGPLRGVPGGPTIGEAFNQANQRVLMQDELLGGRAMQALSQAMAPLGPYQGSDKTAIGQFPEDVRIAAKATVGGDADRARLEGRLETVPTTAKIAGSAIAPSNLIPGIGFVDAATYAKYADDVARFGKKYADDAVRNVPEAVGALRRNPELGGTRLPGGAPEPVHPAVRSQLEFALEDDDVFELAKAVSRIRGKHGDAVPPDVEEMLARAEKRILGEGTEVPDRLGTKFDMESTTIGPNNDIEVIHSDGPNAQGEFFVTHVVEAPVYQNGKLAKMGKGTIGPEPPNAPPLQGDNIRLSGSGEAVDNAPTEEKVERFIPRRGDSERFDPVDGILVNGRYLVRKNVPRGATHDSYGHLPSWNVIDEQTGKRVPGLVPRTRKEALEMARAQPPAPLSPSQATPQTPPPTVANSGNVPPDVPPAGAVPEVPLGTTSIDRAVEYAAETGKKPGVVTQIPGVKQVAGFLNPQISQGRRALHAVQAGESVRPTVEATVRDRAVSAWVALRNAFDASPPRYIGPEDNRFAGTWADYYENPRFYEASPGLAQAQRIAVETQDAGIPILRSEYSVDVSPYRNPNDPNGGYIPHIVDPDSLDDDLVDVAGGRFASKGAYTKQRAFPTNYERGVSEADYVPVTDPDHLADVYAKSMASAARTRAIQVGTGDMTPVRVHEELRPGLKAQRDKVTATVASLKARIDSAYERMRRAGYAEGRVAAQTRKAEQRMEKLGEKYAALTELGRDAGPEYQRLLAQMHELEVSMTRLRNAASGPGGQKVAAQEKMGALQSELAKAEAQLTKLRNAYNAKIDNRKYVYNSRTNRYHPPEEAADMDKLLLSQSEVEHWPIIGPVTQVLRESSLIRVGLDAGYALIQFPLHVLFHLDSFTQAAARHKWRAVTNPGEEIKAFREANPDLVQRFETAHRREWGVPSLDFAQAHRGADRVKPVRVTTHYMNEVLDLFRMKAWENDIAIQKAFDPSVTDNVAEAEAASTGMKMFPSQSTIERGVSAGRGALERASVVAPSFISAPVGMMKDVTSGFAKLVANRHLNPRARWNVLDGREQLAIVRSTMFIGTLGAAAFSTHLAAGYSPERAAKAVYDPNSKRFMSIALPGGRYMPVGTPFRGFIKAMWPHDTEVVPGVKVPGTVTVEGAKIPIPFAGIPEWVAGKAPPPIQFVRRGLIEGKEFDDRIIRKGENPLDDIAQTVWYGIEQHLPLAASGISEGVRRGYSAGDTAEQTLSQLFGGDVRRPTPGEERTSEISDILKDAPDPEVAAQAGLPKHELDVPALLYIEGNEDVKKLSDEIDARQRERGDKGQLAADEVDAMRADIRAEQDQFDAEFNAGKLDPADYVKETTDNQREAWARADQIYIDNDFPAPDASKVPVKAALNDYFNVELKEVNGEDDWDTFDAERKAALKDLSPKQRKDAMTWLQRNKTDTEKKLDNAQNLRNQLYDKPKYEGVTVPEQKQLEGFGNAVDKLRPQVMQELGYEVSAPSVALALGNLRRNPELAETYNKYQDQGISDEYAAALKSSRSTLEPFFPYLYDSATELIAIGAISELKPGERVRKERVRTERVARLTRQQIAEIKAIESVLPSLLSTMSSNGR